MNRWTAQCTKATGMSPHEKWIGNNFQAHSVPHRKFPNLVYLIQLPILFRFQMAIGLATCRETGVQQDSEVEKGQEKKGRWVWPAKYAQIQG